MTMKIRIAEGQDFSQDVIDHLKQFCTVDIAPCEQKDLKTIFQQYDVFWFRLGFRIDADLFSPDMRCKIIASPVTGIDHIDEKACAQFGVKIICLRGERAFLKEVRATAEMTIALTFAVMRNLTAAAKNVLEGDWKRDRFRGFEVYNKTVGIIGLGRLGIITAEYFKALGANVLGYDIHQESIPGFVQMEERISDLIQKSDIISIHVKYDESTHHLINEQLFSYFDNKKWLINTSRGGIVDETALLNSLKENRIAGAALDVVQDEHLFNIENPLVKYARDNRNLLIVPHIGGNTYESFEKTEWFIAKKILKEIAVWQS
jgi:D-3-phosphoglycerate dehydrogenase